MLESYLGCNASECCNNIGRALIDQTKKRPEGGYLRFEKDPASKAQSRARKDRLQSFTSNISMHVA